MKRGIQRKLYNMQLHHFSLGCQDRGVRCYTGLRHVSQMEKSTTHREH
jgi:hypothetical protein